MLHENDWTRARIDACRWEKCRGMADGPPQLPPGVTLPPPKARRTA